MPANDTEYYRARAIGEQDVAAIHEELARQYQALVDKAELRPTLRIAVPTRRSA